MKLSRNAQTLAGLALMLGGAYAIHTAWEGRGGRRPFLLRFVPG